jgi:two-component system LytT family sensor kinase
VTGMDLTREPPAPPDARRTSKRPWLPWALSFGAWSLLEFLFFTQVHVSRIVQGVPRLSHSWDIASFAGICLAALLTPVIISLARHFPLDRQRWPRNLALHLVLAVTFNTLDVTYDKGLSLFLELTPNPSIAYRFSREFALNMLTYAVVLAIGHTLVYYRQLSERRARESELEAQLLQARLQALEMQLRPHFLFNALHTVASLVRTQQNPEAVRAIAGLGDLLRAVLHQENSSQVVPLRQELAFIEKYLGIEQIRFQDRLHTRIEVEPETLDALVPRLILQPLVENAIRHGIEASEGAGVVEIRVHQAAGRLWMQVRNSGEGPDEQTSPEAARGIGLKNTRARLQHLYGEGHSFELAHAEGGGALARVGIPLQRTAAETRP